jgi:acetyl-CoA carboxylase biotin carboxyl carrier protein
VTDPKRPDEVEALIAEFTTSGLRELHVRCDDFEIYLSNDPQATGLEEGVVTVTEAVRPPPAARAPAHPPARVQAARRIAEAPDGLVFVRAPYMGTFYRAPKPGAPVFVDVGSDVTPDTDLCLVEVMKLFTAVRAPMAGRVHAVLAEDGQMVEVDQPLFELIPA